MASASASCASSCIERSASSVAAIRILSKRHCAAKSCLARRRAGNRSRFASPKARGSEFILACRANSAWKRRILRRTSTIISRFSKNLGRLFSLIRECSDAFAFTLEKKPPWWASLPPALTSRAFTAARLSHILLRRRRSPLKALLLMQQFFPGVGNWMADEILWQARLHPRVAAGALDNAAARELWRVMRSVCRVALKTIGVDWSDPPAGWLIHQRWKGNGRCPRDAIRLNHVTVGGRTTAWCSRCQKLARSQRAGAAASCSGTHDSDGLILRTPHCSG